MKVNNLYNAMRVPNHVNIIPAEYLSGDDILDVAVVATIMTAGGLYPRRMLEDIADIIRSKHPNYPKRVAETCKLIAEEGGGRIDYTQGKSAYC